MSDGLRRRLPGSLGLVSLCALLVVGSGATQDMLTNSFASVPAATPQPPWPSLQLRVRDDSPLPAGCTVQMVVDVLLGFIDAFNRGDTEAAIAYFPIEEGFISEPNAPTLFSWFAVGGGPDTFNPGFIAHNREELRPYLTERHAQRERLYLLQVDMGGAWDGKVHYTFDVMRQADDIPTHEAGGKGIADCDQSKIILWNLSDRPSLPDFLNPPPMPTCPAEMPKCE